MHSFKMERRTIQPKGKKKKKLWQYRNALAAAGAQSWNTETGWDLGPLATVLQCLKFSLNPKIQRNCTGLEVTECMCSQDKLLARKCKKIKKKKKSPAATSEWLGEKQGVKARCFACPLNSIPPKEWANHLSHFILTPCQEPVHPILEEQARESVTCSCSPLLQQGSQ